MIGVARRRYSEADRQAAKDRDAALATEAEEALADPDFGAQVIELLTTPRLLSYSVRNQALLLVQARKRGTTLSHLKPFEGWLKVGRCVRGGETCLRLVEHRSGRGEDGGGEDGESRKSFRWVRRFDFSQTEPLEGFDGEVEEEPTEEDLTPGAALFESLSKQADRLGYLLVAWPDEPHAVEAVYVDHEAREIRVFGDHTPETLALLVGAVAHLTLARPKSETTAEGRERSRPAREQPERPSRRAESEELVITVM